MVGNLTIPMAYHLDQKTGTLNSFITFYRNRKFHKDVFEGVPKTGVYSKETTENIKVIFNTYFDIEEV